MKPIIQKTWMLMAMLCAYLSASAYDIEVDGIYYNIFAASKTAKVTCGEELYSGTINIPEYVSFNGHNLSVVGIDESAFKDCSDLISIDLPNTIEDIGSNAFSGCSSLASISLPDSMTSIGSSSFEGCSSLIAVKLPNSITSIPSASFKGCLSLVSIELPCGITTIGNGAFSGCASLSSIELPSNLMSIGDSAFKGCTSLTSIELPSDLTSIGKYKGPFIDCSSLLEIVLPEAVTEVPQDAFAGCTSLKEIDLSTQSTYLSGSCFSGCSALSKIGNMSSARYSDPYVFWSCNLNELIVGDGLSGFPFEYHYNNSGMYKGSFQTYTMDSQKSYWSYGFGSKYKNYLQNLKRIIIEDSVEDFSIKVSFDATDEGRTIPAFSNIDLEYFYVGRPLIDNKSFSYRYYETDAAGHQNTCHKDYYVSVAQGYGHIETLEIGGKCNEVPYFYQKVDTLILGVGINRIDMSNIYVNDLSSIICWNSIPTIMTNINRIPPENYLKTTVYVPYGCKETYSKTYGWENFWDIVEIELSGVEDIDIDLAKKYEVGRYDMNGRAVSEDYQGLVIVRFSDGSSKKMLNL